MSNLPAGARLDRAQTIDLIRSFQPVDPVSTQYQSWALDLVNKTPDFANRYHYTPGHLTAQAVVVNPDLQSVAMMLHKKLDLWMMFGGHVEPGDADLIATARREAEEEAGLRDLSLLQQTPFDIDVHGFPARGDQPDHLHYDLRFIFETASRDLVLNPDECRAIEWVKISDLRQRLQVWLANSRLIKGLESRYG